MSMWDHVLKKIHRQLDQTFAEPPDYGSGFTQKPEPNADKWVIKIVMTNDVLSLRGSKAELEIVLGEMSKWLEEDQKTIVLAPQNHQGSKWILQRQHLCSISLTRSDYHMTIT